MISPTTMSRAAFTKAQLKPVVKTQPAPGVATPKPAPLTTPPVDNRSNLGVEIKMPDPDQTGSAGGRG